MLFPQLTKKTAIRAMRASIKREMSMPTSATPDTWAMRAREAAPVIAYGMVASAFLGFLLARHMDRPTIDSNKYHILRIARMQESVQQQRETHWNEPPFPSMQQQ